MHTQPTIVAERDECGVGGRFRWRLYNLTAAAASPSLLDGGLLGRRLKRSTLASCSARFRIMEPCARLFKLERTP